MFKVPIWAWILVSALATACTHSSPPAETPALETSPSSTPVIQLQKLVIREDGATLARLLPDGRTQYWLGGEGNEEIWIPGPTLRADGTLIFKDGVTGRVEPDGRIFVVNRPGRMPAERLFGRISGDTCVLGNAEHVIRVEGHTLLLPNRPTPNEIEGLTDARSRHTALVMAAAFYINLAIVRE
ncbi:hypothetical protein [Polyangium jinanense]|uniref:Uncharacterized protein n=1 Tax=Polyangium jinanense TaxID=2829994 RepID=A0A9X3XJY5_9BACT|nr:hypothetical protein [Polyangium jinanense]MDC3989546.1 hypothetical protein [Polyangium jinanense]